MTNNISGNEQKLDAFIDSVRQDTPDLSTEELLALITKSEDRPVGAFMRQNNTPSNQRRIVVMSIVAAIILTASFFLATSDQQEEKLTAGQKQTIQRGPQSEQPSPSKPGGASGLNLPEEYLTKISPQLLAEDETPAKNAIVDTKRWQEFIHKPIDLQAFTPIDITPDQFASLGLLQTDSGEVIYYHKEYKFGFPLFEYIRQFNDKDPNKKLLGMRPFYAQYVTDSRGNMMMHYENKSINGGNSVMIGMYDRDLSELLKHIKYYGNSTINSTQIDADTAKDLLTLRIVIKEGIQRVDTVLVGSLKDQSSIGRSEQAIAKQLRAKDSLLKMSLGGMDAIARDYAFDFADSLNPIVQRTKIVFGIIDRSSKTEMEKISAKLQDLFEFMDAIKQLEDKLRIEQLIFKLQYEQYVEQSKLEAEELSNPIDLVAIKVRPSTGLKANPKLDNGLIFWYRDSDTLRSILDAKVANVRSSLDPKLKLSVMPNPAMLYLYVNYTVEAPSPLRVTLADITGKQVYTDVWKASAGAGKKEINVQQIPNGIYMLVLDSERGRSTRQVIIQHQ